MSSAEIPHAVDRHVRRSGSDYATALSALLPTGIAWPRDAASLLMHTVSGLANVWGFVDGRAGDLLERESDPRATLEMLDDWERAYGLPDLCVNEPQGITARRAALLRRITTIGAQSRQYFIGLAKDIGYDINITEYSPFQIGVSHVGYTKGYNKDAPSRYRWYLGPPEMRFFWTIDVGKLAEFYFHCAAGQCGIDPLLRNGKATDLECIINRSKPAHTIALFDYSHLHIKISPPAAQLTLSPVAPVKVYSRDPKKISPNSANLALSTTSPQRASLGKFSIAQANAVLSTTAPFLRVGVPAIFRSPTRRDLALSTTAPTVIGWTPAVWGNAVLWYRPEGLLNSANQLPADGDAINVWHDSSPNAMHLHPTFVGGGSSPIYRSAGLNGKPTVDFSSSSGMSAFLGLSGTPGALSIFAVAIMNSASESDAGLASFSGTTQINDYDNVVSLAFGRESTNQTVRVYRNLAELGSKSAPAYGTPMRLGMAVGNGIGVSYVNNVVGSAQITSTAPFAQNAYLTVGAGYQGNQPWRFWHGPISEIVIIGGLLSGADQNNLDQYFRLKYGL